MKKGLFVNLLALLCSVAVFTFVAAFSGTSLGKLETANFDANVNGGNNLSFDDDFLQESDMGIGDILESETDVTDSGASSEASSDETSSELQGESSSETKSEAHSSETLSSSSASSESHSSEAQPSEVYPSEETSSALSSIPEIYPSEEESRPSGQQSSIPVIYPEDDEPSNGGGFTPPSGDYSEIVEIVAGAVQREIVGQNTAPSQKYYEAYKAQAIACHSYMEYHRQRTGSYPQMSYATPHPKTVELVSEVIDELMYYNGSVINASYHAASGGYTQSAYYVWGNSIPYLSAVESAYDDYSASYTISESAMRSKLEAYGISVNGSADYWFDASSFTYTDGDFVDTLEICGKKVKARTLRENILGGANLKSTKIIDIYYDGQNFIFKTKGFGHGVGLSQLGALGYSANEGWSCYDILHHYYSGITIN